MPKKQIPIKTKKTQDQIIKTVAMKAKVKLPEKSKKIKPDSIDLGNQIKILKAQARKFNKEKGELSQRVADLENQLREKAERNSKLESDINQVNGRVENTNKEKGDLSQKVADLENQLREKAEQNSKLESDINQANGRVENTNKEKGDLSQRVTGLETQVREKTDQISKLESEISETNSKVENLRKENDRLAENIVNAEKTIGELRADNENLKEQMKKEKAIFAQEWARGLVGMLRKVSNLAGREPQNTQGLTPRAVYEDLLAWMEKAFSEKPRPFPSGETIELDASSEDILELKNRYDWGVEIPFAGVVGKKTFRIIQRGWQLKTEILLPAVVTAEQSDSEVSHE